MTMRSISGRDLFDGAGLCAPLHDSLADVITIKPSRLAGVGRRHRGAIGSEQQPLQQRRRLRPRAGRPSARVLFENGMRLVPEFAVDDGLVLAAVGDTLVHGLADVDPVVQELIEDALVEQVAVAVGSTGDD